MDPLEADPSAGETQVSQAMSAHGFNARLSGLDAAAALQQITRWLDAIAPTPASTAQTVQTIELLERLARSRQFRIAPQVLDAKRLRQLGQSPLWQASTDCWRALGDAYGRCLPSYRADVEAGLLEWLPTLAGRWQAALGQQLKWALLHYARVETRIWRDLGRSHRLAEQWGIATQRCTIEPGRRRSTPQQELLKVLLFAAAAPDALTPMQQQIADRLGAHLSGRFVLSGHAAAGCHFGFDLAAAQPPTRVGDCGKATLARCFGPGSAIEGLAQLERQLRQTGVVPPELRTGGGCTAAEVIATLEHLARQWSGQRIERRSRRQAASTRLTVVGGLVGTSRWLQRHGATLAAPQESWDAFDASATGFGAWLPPHPADWLAIGTLIGLRSDSEPQQRIGILRRIAADSDHRQRAGIELAGDCAIPVALHPESPRLAPESAPSGQAAILVNRKTDAQGTVELLLPPDGLMRARALQMQVGHRIYQVEPLQLIEQGSDWRRISCRVHSRE